MQSPYQHHQLKNQNTLPVSFQVRSSFSRVQQCSCCYKSWAIVGLVLAIIRIIYLLFKVYAVAIIVCEALEQLCSAFQVYEFIQIIISLTACIFLIILFVKAKSASNKKTLNSITESKKWLLVWSIAQSLNFFISKLLSYYQELLFQEYLFIVSRSRFYISNTFIVILFEGLIVASIIWGYCYTYCEFFKAVRDYEQQLRSVNQYSERREVPAGVVVAGNVLGKVVNQQQPIMIPPSQIEMQNIRNQQQ